MYVSSPSRKMIARKPSHLVSNSQPSPSGSASAGLASIGSIGGSKGRCIEATVPRALRERRADCVEQPDEQRRHDQAGQEVREPDLLEVEQAKADAEQDDPGERGEHEDRHRVEEAGQEKRPERDATLDDEDLDDRVVAAG